MSETTILARIEELAEDVRLRKCLLELLDFERGSESCRVYMPTYKSILQSNSDGVTGPDEVLE